VLLKLGVIIFIVLGSTVLALVGTRLPPELARGIPFLIPLVAFAPPLTSFSISPHGNQRGRADGGDVLQSYKTTSLIKCCILGI
jgi:hypothetical protein